MAFILAFSTIMLQTNLHNPAIRDDKRMTREQFIKQNKGKLVLVYVYAYVLVWAYAYV